VITALPRELDPLVSSFTKGLEAFATNRERPPTIPGQPRDQRSPLFARIFAENGYTQNQV